MGTGSLYLYMGAVVVEVVSSEFFNILIYKEFYKITKI